MGKLLSKFRKEKSTIEQLEGLDEKIKKLEAFTVSTQARQKRLIGSFLVISIGLYVIAFLVFYFVFFPPTWNERVVYSTPMLLFPILIFLIKRMVAWYFQRKMNKNSTELQKLRSEKKKILEEVQEKETYKVALEILKKFADPGPVRPLEMATLTPNNRLQQQQQPIARTPLTPAMRTPQPLPRQRILTSPQIASQFRSPQMMASQQQQNQQMLNRSAFFQSTPVLQRPRTPFPIIDQRDKGMLEKMVDYLIGDGPANRFAMICKNCFGHNGMVLQEEYDYASFKCAFCSTLNPAKKQRPIAPRLEVPTRTEILDSSSSTSEEEKNSPPESDAEIDNVRSNTNAHEENNTSIEENNDNNDDDGEIKKIDETEITEVAEEQEPKTEIEKKDD